MIYENAYPQCMSLENVSIYDTTLRDGEQAPGVRFSIRQKLSIARRLAEIGIPEIEAGFPAVSQEEKLTVRKIARDGLNSRILALSRIVKKDIDAVIESEADAIILFASVSPLLLKYKMHKTLEEVIAQSVESVEYARAHGLSVIYSAEDATRTNLNTLMNVYKEVEKAGASRVHIADTVGVATPHSISFMVYQIRKRLDSRTELCMHCHNDFGLATANALSGLAAGANIAAATVNGIGERAGNVCLAELVMCLRILYGMDNGYDLKELQKLSKLVEKYSGIKNPPQKPLMGLNAFRHESGIHVAAVLENPLTYEPFAPEVLGIRRQIVLGKHSGKKAVIAKMDEKGRDCSAEEARIILEKLKKPEK
ncbi:MAG: homoaconitate hydratase [Candidatus Altiarchaeia archaeon]